MLITKEAKRKHQSFVQFFILEKILAKAIYIKIKLNFIPLYKNFFLFFSHYK